MKNPLTIHSDASESLHYNIDSFPLYTHKDELYNYDYQALVHWHPDLEFIYIVKGTMDYFVNNHIVRLKEGEGIFVNSQRLHYGFSKEHYDCTFIALVISPNLFVHINQSAKDYFDLKFGMKNTDYIVLYPHVKWQKEIIDEIVMIHTLMQNFTPLKIISKAISIIDHIGEHINDSTMNNHDSIHQDVFLSMCEFISHNYSEKITIENMSKKVGITRNDCCKIFKQFSNMTPNEYITQYRINKSIELLNNTHLSILEISELCGFSSPSYFTSVFQKEKGILPKKFRNNKSV